MSDHNNIFRRLGDALRASNPNAPEAEVRAAMRKLRQGVKHEADMNPPVIAFIGLSGVGKSSTINALFNAGVAVSHFEPCTKVAEPLTGDLFELTGRKGKVIIYDMPGLGEDLVADEDHYQTYLQTLPRVDVAIWVVAAPERAMAPIQSALLRLAHDGGTGLTDKIVFAVNKIDRVYPGETAWIPAMNIPSPEQRDVLDSYIAVIDDAIARCLPGHRGKTVPYSATRRYNLEVLMSQVVLRTSHERAWVVDEAAAVADFTELVDPRFLDWYRRQNENGAKSGIGREGDFA